MLLIQTCIILVNDMTASLYTAITFSPVQGFIEKSRKLRDLYGSSFILSFLSRALCDAARRHLRSDAAVDLAKDPVVSPALVNVTQGTPNQIVIQGDFPEDLTHRTLTKAWQAIVDICRDEVERRLPAAKLPGHYTWHRAWDAWGNHTWECFWAQGESISDARDRLNEAKRGRAWVGINWQGESSTLSGADAIAWYGMAEKMHPKANFGEQYHQIRDYCRKLSQALPLTLIDETEQLSIPELIKRVLMIKDAEKNPQAFQHRVKDRFQALGLPAVEPPAFFTEVNRFAEERWTGWFQGDGDRIGRFLKSSGGEKPDVLHAFSKAMLAWGSRFQVEFKAHGRVVYAGGDDFLGIFYRHQPEPPLSGQAVLSYFSQFPTVWESHGQRDAEGRLLTVSVGLVWAAPNVPQRDILQHCKEAEQAAKRGGRDRLCLRVLFNSGNYLEWQCPWWLLAGRHPALAKQGIFGRYRDLQDQSGPAASWDDLFKDVATLEARHGFRPGSEVALALFEIYFGAELAAIVKAYSWDQDSYTGILGNQERSAKNTQQRLTQWVINLAKVGFHLHRSQSSKPQPDAIAALP